jgi:hypothetical protein
MRKSSAESRAIPKRFAGWCRRRKQPRGRGASQGNLRDLEPQPLDFKPHYKAAKQEQNPHCTRCNGLTAVTGGAVRKITFR